MRRQRQAQWQAQIQDDFKDKSDAHVEINVGNFKPFSKLKRNVVCTPVYLF